MRAVVVHIVLAVAVVGVLAVAVIVGTHVVRAAAHHREHRPPARDQEAPYEQGGHDEKDDVEHACVVPADAVHADPSVPLASRDEPQDAEQDLDQVAGRDRSSTRTTRRRRAGR
jgi:hypothetical protein